MRIRRSKKMKALYLFRKDGNVCAISDSFQEILQYKNQFPEYFRDEDCSIESVIDKNQIDYLLDQYTRLELDWLTENIIVTQWEWYFYDDKLHEAYKDTKAMMSQMILYARISTLSIEEKSQMQKTFDMLYGHIKCYDDFIKSLDSEEIMKKYIMDPTTCMNTILMDAEYKMAILEDD